MYNKNKSVSALLVVLFFTLTFKTTPASAVNVLTPLVLMPSKSDAFIFTVTPSILDKPSKKSFQWYLSGKAIPGEIKPVLKLDIKSKGKEIFVKETNTFLTGLKQILTSQKFKVGQIYISPLKISLSEDGKSIFLDEFEVRPTSAKLIYLWYRGAFDIPGANKSTYSVATADQGGEVYLTITADSKNLISAKFESNSISIPKMIRNYTQIWSDEFDQGKINSNIWTSQNGDGNSDVPGSQLDFSNDGWGNRERQYYTSDQTNFDGNGSMVIKATRTGASKYNCYYRQPCEWLSSRFITSGKIGFKFGRIEARIKGPITKNGTWGAFWLLGARCNLSGKEDKTWPLCGEIDIAELLGKYPDTNFGTIHGPGFSGGGGLGSTVRIDKGFSDEYHNYAIDWLPDQITWYVDGVPFHTENKLNSRWVFDHEFYLIINLAIGGNFGGDVDPNLNETEMKVDWVRVSTINGVGEVVKY